MDPPTLSVGRSHFQFQVCLEVFFISSQILIEHSVSKQWGPDQTLSSVASDLVLQCLPMSHKKDARTILLNLKNARKAIVISPVISVISGKLFLKT